MPDLRRPRVRRHREGRGQRHHVGHRDREPSHRRLRQPRARLCADPERLRSSLHVLHHPVRPRAIALGAGGRSGGASEAPGRARLCRDRADGGRHHGLWPRPSRRDDARQAGAEGAQARARAAAAQALLDQLRRGRSRSDGGDRRGGAADAASPSLAAGRRRPHAEAHEAPPFARSLCCVLRGGAARAPGHGVRRGPHRGLPHRDRGHVQGLARARR